MHTFCKEKRMLYAMDGKLKGVSRKRASQGRVLLPAALDSFFVMTY